MIFIPYVLPLILGSTFDLDKLKIGVNIFPKDALLDKQIYEAAATSTYYGIIDRAEVARDLVFGRNIIHLAMGLKVKTGDLDAGATGKYLFEVIDRRNTVEVMIKGHYTRGYESLPFDVKPISDWKKYGKALGTHYVRSIMYGGDIIASVRFHTNSSKVKEMIEAPISNRLFDLADPESEISKDILKYVESTEIKVFSSIPLKNYPTDLKSLKEVLDNFPKELNKYNEGRGVPIQMQLSSLDDLDLSTDGKRKDRIKDWSIDLEQFEDHFNDLLETELAVTDWMKRVEKSLTTEQKRKVGDLIRDLEFTLQLYYGVIHDLNLSQGPEQLKEAEDVYGTGVSFSKFYRKFLRLREEIEKELREAKSSNEQALRDEAKSLKTKPSNRREFKKFFC